MKWNVKYDRGDGTSSFYLKQGTTFEIAARRAASFDRQYVDKPYPNGLGSYPFVNPRVVRVS